MATHLITGGAGFIGVNLVRRLLADGHEAIVVDDMSRGRIENLGVMAGDPRVRVERLDCVDVSPELWRCISHVAPGAAHKHEFGYPASVNGTF